MGVQTISNTAICGVVISIILSMTVPVAFIFLQKRVSGERFQHFLWSRNLLIVRDGSRTNHAFAGH